MTDTKRQIKLSKDFISRLKEISAGYFSPGDFTKLTGLFETEIKRHYFTYNSESNLLRIISAMFDKISFLYDCIEYPHYVEIITAVSSNSNYLTDILVRNPEYFYRIVNPSHLNGTITGDQFSQVVRETVSVFKTFNARVNALRSLKRREILRIGLKDILGISDLKEITGELSILAGKITEELFSLCYSEVLSKYNLQGLDPQYCIIGLGKLGGMELNYSSDIDLMIFYEKNITANSKNYNELLTEVIQLFVENSTAVTSGGYIYRVDFRLRPDGKYSPLSRSINEYINYYESRGEDWERQMLIKAAFIAGSRTLYDRLMNYLSHYIYPSSFSVSPAEQIRRLKSSIERKIGEEENIKLISGGIRDIEFSVQALQLINGGRNAEIRKSNSLEAIGSLRGAGLLSGKEAGILEKAYIIYRRIEHFLQLMNDIQTHTIPSEGEILEKLSLYLGFKDSAGFKRSLEAEKKEVLKIFNSITGSRTPVKQKASAGYRINFESKARAEQNLRFLHEGKSLLGQKKFDTQSIAAFEKIEAGLMKYLSDSVNPDTALENFARIIKDAALPSVWYNAFTEDKFFKYFLDICEFSQKAVDLFSEDNDLREYFLSKKVFEPLKKSTFKSLSYKNFLLTLYVGFCIKKINAEKVMYFLSDYLKYKLQQHAQEKIEEHLTAEEYFIAGMGSLGSGEMTFASDIDVIFISADLDPASNVQKVFQNYLLYLKEMLKPFDVDCRLRPEGKSSLLVWDYKSYLKYIDTRVRTWELQAFCKLNFIAGNKKLFDGVTEGVFKRLLKEDKENLRKDILGMRKQLYPAGIREKGTSFNIKKSRGGIADIRFLLDYIILSSPSLFKSERGKETLKITRSAGTSDKSLKEFVKLEEHFLFLKTLELSQQNIFNSTLSAIPQDERKLKIIARHMEFSTPEKLKKKIFEVANFNSIIFKKYLEKN